MSLEPRCSSVDDKVFNIGVPQLDNEGLVGAAYGEQLLSVDAVPPRTGAKQLQRLDGFLMSAGGRLCAWSGGVAMMDGHQVFDIHYRP